MEVVVSHGADSSLEVIRELGRGGFGRVELVRDAVSGQLFAQKILEKSDSHDVFIREASVHRKLHHPSVVRCYAVLSGAHPSILLERCDGDLRSHAEGLNIAERKKVAIKITEGLIYVHTASIVHSDIKSQNILMLRGEPKIADFGLSFKCSAEQMVSKILVNKFG